LTNVEVVKGDEDDPHLTASSLDAAVIVNSYHEMREYQRMLHHLRGALKPDGRLVIVEPLSDRRRHHRREQQIREHEIAPAFVEEEAREAGFRIVRLEDPFTTRDTDSMWLLVAVPDPTASTQRAICPLVPAKTPMTPPAPEDHASATSDPDLRIAFDRFKKLYMTNARSSFWTCAPKMSTARDTSRAQCGFRFRTSPSRSRGCGSRKDRSSPTVVESLSKRAPVRRSN
jgi:SAM-dependent methyltransferase